MTMTLPQLAKRLENRMPKDARRVQTRVLNHAKQKGVNTAKREAPKRTGTLERGIKGVNTPRGFAIGVPNSIEYAKYQEFGTKYIKAKRFMEKGMDAAVNEIIRAGYTRRR